VNVRFQWPRARLLTAGGFAMLLALPATSLATPSIDRTASVADAIRTGQAKNVIFLLGDGMGDSEITLARDYAVGAAGKLKGIDALPLTGEVKTYSVQEASPSVPDYVPDSAATGTAWATGRKTSDGRISTTPGTDQDLDTILELAQVAGYQTGNVSTAEITDATPAVLDSHVIARGCQGPTDMSACPLDKKSAGGPGSIAEQTVDHHVDVVLGGGKGRFDQVIDGGPYLGQTVVQSAMAQGYNVVTTRAGLLAASNSQRVLGLFTSGNMTTEWSGSIATPYPGTAAQTCVETNRPAIEPSLADMTNKAIKLLNHRAVSNGDQGFFLQVEGASIDKQDHAANPCAQIGETVAFDKAIQVALAFARTHARTLVIVTADHAHTSQIIENEATATSHSPGLTAVLNTFDGAQITVNYGTNLVGQSQQHTGSEVRVAAVGPQAANVLGIIDQTELFHIMARALGIE
jgi:alkaline phosphatase